MPIGNVYALLILATVLWGGNFVLAEPILGEIPPLWAAGLRFLLAALIMIAIAGWRREPLLPMLRQHAAAYALLGMVGIGVFNILFFYALQHTSADNAALIMATNPLLTTVLATLFLGERLNARQLAALPLALVGVVVVITGGHPAQLLSYHVASGDLLMLLGNLAWALYNILSRRYMPAAPAFANTTLVISAGALMLFATALIHGAPPAHLHLPALAALLGMAFFGTVFAYLLWNLGIARIGASRTALFLNLVPVFAMLLGMLGGTLPAQSQLVGGLLVIGAVSLAMVPLRRRRVVVCRP